MEMEKWNTKFKMHFSSKWSQNLICVVLCLSIKVSLSRKILLQIKAVLNHFAPQYLYVQYVSEFPKVTFDPSVDLIYFIDKCTMKSKLDKIPACSECKSNFRNLSYACKITIYSVTNSTRAIQPFSANHKTSSEQKNRSSVILDQSPMRDLQWKVVYFHQRKDN